MFLDMVRELLQRQLAGGTRIVNYLTRLSRIEPANNLGFSDGLAEIVDSNRVLALQSRSIFAIHSEIGRPRAPHNPLHAR